MFYSRKWTENENYLETDTLAVAILDGSLSDDARRVTLADGELPAS